MIHDFIYTSGIGDYLLLAWTLWFNNIKDVNIYIDKDTINLYRPEYISLCNLYIKYFNNIFSTNIRILDDNNYYHSPYYNYDSFILNTELKIPEVKFNTKNCEKYHLINTKYKDYSENLDDAVDKILNSIKTNGEIYIVGEKELDYNYEYRLPHYVNCTGSVYNLLINKLTKTNLKYKDLTFDSFNQSYYTNENYFDNFLRDLDLYKNCEASYTIGCGGHFCFSFVFSKCHYSVIDDSRISQDWKIHLSKYNLSKFI